MTKVSSANSKSIKENKKQFQELGIIRCEISGKDFALSFAHKEKRIEYRNCPEKLYDINEVILITIPLHNWIEHRRELTLELFKCLRPVKDYQDRLNARNKAKQLIVKSLEKENKIYLLDKLL